MLSTTHLLTAVLAGSSVAHAAYSIASESDIKTSAKQLAADLMAYYHGDDYGGIPGILPGPPPNGDYYWWEGGALWGTMIDYWHLTGDTTYNNVTKEAMLFQVGPQDNYEPPNVTASLGNDDQGFWGMSAMLAAENNFENPPDDQPQWLALAQAVFNRQASPDDTMTLAVVDYVGRFLYPTTDTTTRTVSPTAASSTWVPDWLGIPRMRRTQCGPRRPGTGLPAWD